MNILGIGIDIVELARIESMIARHGDRFLDRVFTPEERRYCSNLRTASRCYAARFAAKEAVSKAFGTGIGARVGWLDLEIERDPAGKPSVCLLNAAAAFAQELGITQILVTLSHAEHYAVAQAIAIGA
jgi:holo-[acyl-carrier protein] synthase